MGVPCECGCNVRVPPCPPLPMYTQRPLTALRDGPSFELSLLSHQLRAEGKHEWRQPVRKGRSKVHKVCAAPPPLRLPRALAAQAAPLSPASAPRCSQRMDSLGEEETGWRGEGEGHSPSRLPLPACICFEDAALLSLPSLSGFGQTRSSPARQSLSPFAPRSLPCHKFPTTAHPLRDTGTALPSPDKRIPIHTFPLSASPSSSSSLPPLPSPFPLRATAPFATARHRGLTAVPAGARGGGEGEERRRTCERGQPCAWDNTAKWRRGGKVELGEGATR